MAEKALQRMSLTLGCRRVTLWVLTNNFRALNFHEKPGLRHDDADMSSTIKVKFGTVDAEERRYC